MRVSRERPSFPRRRLCDGPAEAGPAVFARHYTLDRLKHGPRLPAVRDSALTMSGMGLCAFRLALLCCPSSQAAHQIKHPIPRNAQAFPHMRHPRETDCWAGWKSEARNSLAAGDSEARSAGCCVRPYLSTPAARELPLIVVFLLCRVFNLVGIHVNRQSRSANIHSHEN